MAAPLLETKLFVPKPRAGLVARPRLGERLGRALSARLTLVSAPPGFGKTTLLVDWLATLPASADHGPAVGWLSLDSRDSDPIAFWGYLVAAVNKAVPQVGAAALELLGSPQPAPVQEVLTSLINELGGLEDDLVLVLDDYHVVDSPEVQEGMSFLLGHQPPQLHLVIVGRADPALPLARMRARGELVEVRAADLRFRPEEAAAYFDATMGSTLSATEVTALADRTEGWIAALQLAALSLQGRDDVGAFISEFSGDDRYVVDYLVEEVLHRQSDEMQAFLLETSVLGRLNGALCDEVTEGRGGKAMLDALDQANLFVVPLDDRREWYRYHHLFADVLQARLLHQWPERVAGLHRRASAWFEASGDLVTAIDHALAADDFEHAADLVELVTPAMRRDRRELALRRWLDRLPAELYRNRPVLAINYVGALLATNELAGVEDRLNDAERWLGHAVGEPVVPDQPVVLDVEDFRRLPGWTAVYRAGLACVTGDSATTLAQARRALSLLEGEDLLGHGAASALVGLASWANGDLETAHQAYGEAMEYLRRAGHLSDVLGCTITLADLRIAQGRLTDAMRAFRQGMLLSGGPGGTVLRGTPDMHVGISALHRERDDLDGARRHLQAADALGAHLQLPQNPYRRQVAMARVLEAEGDLAGAVACLDEAERVYEGDFSPNVRPVAAMRARVWVAQGRSADALAWARDRGLSADDEPDYLREYEHVTLARVLLAGDARSQADAKTLLERLLATADDGCRVDNVIEILVLQALAHHRSGDPDEALVALRRALEVGEPEGYVRRFIDEGSPMAELLAAAVSAGVCVDHARALLARFGRTEEPPGTEANRSEPGLVDPLSSRELEVLRLLATELSGPDIARELVVSLHTVRTHTKNIYAKLGVTSRRAAVGRAQDLGLLRRRAGNAF